MSDRLIQRSLLNAARTALLLIAIVVQFGLSFAPGTQRPQGAGWGQTVAFGQLAVIAIAGLFYLRKPIGPRLRWAGVAWLLSASVILTITLPRDPVIRAEHWSFGLIGWYALFLLFDQRLRTTATFLAVHALITIVPVFGFTPGFSAMAISVVSVIGFQIGVAMAAAVIRRIAATAAQAQREEENISTREAAAELVHRDRERNHQDLLATTIPVLTGLANGTLDPSEEDTKRRCAIEAARMRRLFAERDESPDPLVHELKAAIDVAERHGVEVHLATRGEPGDLPIEARRALLDPVSEVLAAAVDNARVTVMRGPDSVRLSVKCEVTAVPGLDQNPNLRLDTMGSSLWMEVQWRSR
ncbi:hypothetical protein [Actinocrispum sp. NPDC049592]|uniref:hypothetical protein n=1 Tax=Actinocrispum sp. NPDC049592 TaxID=3154835 RepID=UPI00344865AA